jgi:hypothetical protein
MRLKRVWTVWLFLMIFFAAIAQAGRVETTTQYPSPEGDYRTLQTTDKTFLMTNNTAGTSLGIGTTAPTNIAANDGSANVDLHLTGSIVQDGWVNVISPGVPNFQNGWTDCPAAWGWNSAGYFRDKNGIVHLKGLVQGGTIPSTIFELPAGFRPAMHHLFIVPVHNNTGLPATPCSGYRQGRVTVWNNGQVYAESPNGLTPLWFTLDGVTFRADDY